MPLVPILIAVVVLGFVIGAGLSLVGKARPKNTTTVVASAPQTSEPTLAPVTSAPTDPPAATDAPATAAALVTAAAPQPSPSATAPKPRATHAPTRAPSSAAPVVAAPATPAPPTAAPASAPPTKHTAAPVAVLAQHTAAPVATRAAATRAAATAAPEPVATDDADSEFARLASAVVRQYLGAVGRGDTASARAAFGSNGASDALPETGVVDASTRIQHLEARSAGDNVTVNVDMRTASGLYFGQYTVHRTDTGAALITTHAINKL